MTVIAWDGTTLAVDSLSASNGLTGASRKLHVVERGGFSGLVSGCGHSRAIIAMLRWFEAGADEASFPDIGDGRDNAALITVDSDGRVLEYLGTPYAVEELAVPYAWGAGDTLAVGAMLHGATAVEAAAIACSRSTECGGPILHAQPDRRAIYGDGPK